ncbi:unnamed protein product [Brassica oleracea var. botrytis]
MAKTAKIEFFLEQVRLCLDRPFTNPTMKITERVFNAGTTKDKKKPTEGGDIL